MEKVYNLRELGGIEAADGRRVKDGIFYRSANLNYATACDIEEIKRMNLKAIFDFRDSNETDNYNIYSVLNVEHCSVPIAINSARICNLQHNRTLRNALKTLHKEDMRIAYRNMPFNNSSYKKMIDYIRQNKTPILFHCNVGKDRTGVAAAIILTLLGVDREHIIKDYIESKKVEPFIISFITSKINFLVRNRIKKSMMAVLIADVSYIEAALDAILNKYGSYEEYFKVEYDIDSNELVEIREKYLVKQ